jgi:hypothetical protein
MTKEFPENIQDEIAAMPEDSYGVNRVIVTLDDGTEINDVYVAWAKEIIKVGQVKGATFDPSRVVKVRHQV